MASEKTGARVHPWLLVALLWVVALLNYLDRQVIFSLFPLLERDLGATSVELGLTSTVFLWVYGLLSPFAGYIADRFGRARVILLSLLVWSAVTWWTGHVRSVPELLWARAAMGVSEAFYLPAALAMIVEAHERGSKALAAGVHQSGLYVGLVMGGAWGGWMGDHYGWRPVFTILGAAGVVYFAALWLGLRRSKEEGGAGASSQFLASLRQVLRLPGYGSLAAVFTCSSIAGWLIYTWLPMYLYERFGLSMTQAGFSATFYIQAASFAGILAGGWVSDRWSRSNPRARVLTQGIALGAAAPFLFFVGMASWFPALVAALVMYGIGRGVYDSNTMPALSQIAPERLRATGYGIFNLCGCLVGGVTAAFAGYLRQAIGLAIAFELAGALLLVCGVVLARLRLSYDELGGAHITR